MVEGTVGKELLALEREYWNAIVNKDASSAADLSDDPCVVVGAQGVGEVDKQALARMLEDPSYDLTEYGIEDIHVRPIADGVVVVAYKVKEKLVVDGEQVALEAFDSSVWVRRRGRKWVCALHTESLAGDPFGRH